MATVLTGDATGEGRSQPRSADDTQPWTRSEWLWTLFGLALFVAFLFLLLDDSPLRGVLAVQ